jgi:hypothetical protein
VNPVHKAIIEYIIETNFDKLIVSTDEQLIHRMFRNYRGERGMRLTKFGLEVMQCFFTAFEIDVPDDEVLTPKHLICLDDSAVMPYYFDTNHIVVFDAEFGMKLRLVNGRLSTLMNIEVS